MTESTPAAMILTYFTSTSVANIEATTVLVNELCD